MKLITEVRPEIEALTLKFLQTFMAGDVTGTVEMYTADAIMLAPNHDFLRGREAIRGFWQGFIDNWRPIAPVEAQMGLLEVEQVGDSVLEIGWYRFKIQPPGSPAPQPFYVKFFCRWKQEDGQWKVAVDSFSRNDPPALPGFELA